MKQIAPHVYIENSYRGVTVGCIITDSGVICMDSPLLPADARRWRAQIAKHSDRPVRYVVLTDADRDRIASLQYLGGTVIAHEATWEKMKNCGDAFRQQVADLLASCYSDVAPSEVLADLRVVLPEITFTHKLVLHHGASPVVIQHVGGATPGSVWIHLPQQSVLFMGDLLTPHTHPAVSESDIGVWLDRLDQVRQRDFPAKIIVPGRGNSCSKAALEPMADYLRAMYTRVLSLIRSRRSRADTASLAQEFLARYPVPESDRECAQRRVKAGLDHLYDTLKNKK